ncbi:MAG TPA: hypothetical protein HPP77_02635 [Candidatus Hydrogenedentes bacterium]|nr:hypothetical protein [Candidatus Hydrogenedentota bacterium]HIJ73118.1 hypothetical protein [Candidatus Hydrogenedentota bacterium]
MRFAEQRDGRRNALVREEWAVAISGALLRGHGCEQVEGAGRGALERFPFESGVGLIRTYRRGGFVRRFVEDAYFLQNRPLREFQLLVALFDEELPTAEPLGVLWERRGPFYRGKIATRVLEAVGLCQFLGDEVEKMGTVPSRFARLGQSPFSLMTDLGRLVRRMHDLGVYHADLQVHNVLVGAAGDLYLIDFDKAKRFPALTAVQRAQNLFRFRRSLDKNGLDPALFASVCEGYGPVSLPKWLDNAYRLKGRISDIISCRETPAYSAMASDGVVVDRIAGATTYRRADVALDAVLAAVATPGKTLKRAEKSETRTVGAWVVKTSRLGLVETLKRTFYRRRYRQGWVAARFLEAHRVGVPKVCAFIEMRRLGLIMANALISERLEGCRNVEDHARSMAGRGAASDEVRAFLFALADSVNALTATGAQHTDLSGKNIFTRDGASFYFIDLDGVTLGRPYTDAMRMKNHVQLYDSFCDLWHEETLDPFIRRMLPAGYDASEWLRAVHENQARRRAEHLSKSHRQKPV